MVIGHDGTDWNISNQKWMFIMGRVHQYRAGDLHKLENEMKRFTLTVVPKMCQIVKQNLIKHVKHSA